MINVRNRLYVKDGKTSGYPTLQSIYWRYLESQELIGIENNNFTYRSMMEFVDGLGDYWIRLIEQMVPASTIWMTGVKYENSVFHRQKFVYRRQRGCMFVPVPAEPCYIIANIFDYTCQTEFVDFNIYPWFNTQSDVTNFSGILDAELNQYLFYSYLNY